VIAMEAPTSFHADSVRAEKVKVLDAVRSYDCEGCLDNVVRGQYRAGAIDRKPVPGYRQEPDVSPRSRIETYVAMKLLVDNWRWAGVPFYLRTGKRLAAKSSRVAIQFKQAPLALFRDLPGDHRMVRNYLVLQIQPDEGVSLQFGAKVPGPEMTVEEVIMDFRYRDRFAMPPSTGYETLIYDCMRGDATLFQRADFVESGWRVLQPMLDAWQDPRAPGLAGYAAGSDGPKAADALLARDGRSWQPLA
jgi:glucose-6-phosphate 1-dehydrogenase